MASATSLIGAVGIGSSLLGGLTQASGAAEAGAAQQGMYNYQAGVAQINSQISSQNADYARQAGEIQALDYGMKSRAQFGQIRASQGANGLDVNSGSNAQVQSSQRTVSALDMDQIRAGAAQTAYNYDVQSTQYSNQAQLYTKAGSNAAAAANINVASSLLSTASSVSTKWLQASQTGMFGGSSPSGGGSSGFLGGGGTSFGGLGA